MKRRRRTGDEYSMLALQAHIIRALQTFSQFGFPVFKLSLHEL
jgi:hypothetical protein